MALENLQPKEVFHFFEEICNIPHGSGNLQEISDYLVSFAKERNLEVIQDDELNVIIKAPGTDGYEDKESVILQGHMDMVAVKEDDADIDMTSDPLKVMTDGEYVWADKTSLGGDDGIAVAYCLALLDSKDIPHPPLEVVITTNEETGMFGASAIDLSSLKGRKLINIDNEEEGVFITSCAGGARVNSKFSVEREPAQGIKARVEVSGLLGGHSGNMIHLGRGNANIILARALTQALDKVGFSLVSIQGGDADNAIPANSSAEIVIGSDDLDTFKESIAGSEADIKDELAGKDDGLKITVSDLGQSEENAITAKDAARVLSFIYVLPDGVQAMSADVEGLVETSLNLGVLRTEGDLVTTAQAVRSSVETSKNFLIKKVLLLAERYGADAEVNSAYPGWKFNPKSELREHLVAVYKSLYGKDPELLAIHAGLECGLLSEKIEGLDCISIGPDMQDIHSVKEKLSVKSAGNVWEFLKAALK